MPGILVEKIKRDPNEFGGYQTHILQTAEIAERLCCTQFCGFPGVAQMKVPVENPEMYRILCARHFIRIVMTVAAAIGDPSPVEEARRVAQAIGYDWNRILELEPRYLVSPENFICAICGGGMLGETSGRYQGKRWVHTCPG